MSAADLAPLAMGTDAARRLGARRGYLGDTSVNRELWAILRDHPERFGRVGSVVLGADEVRVPESAGPRGFVDSLAVYGLESIDGFQRLSIIAAGRAEWGVQHIARSTVRLEIQCGRDRDVARMLHDTAHGYVNRPTAQDGLIRCPRIQALMACNWEGMGYFDPRRGASVGPHRKPFPMPEVTRALACLAPRDDVDAVHLAATDEGLDRLWGDIGSELYRGVFPEGMSPLGVVRAVEAYRAAHGALREMPARQKAGAGHLSVYAPDLVCRVACRRLLPVGILHDEQRSRYDWQAVIRHQLPAVVRQVAEELVRRYEAVRRVRGSRRHYKDEAVLLDVWREILR
ncbi:hypothetical protein ABT154_26935 [Streptomyces sp. NPDC001728]|uniref:hypothetical protein n=1 Tax=Streptomyces sp. NPDC001728 TaxID=3154396 RepID=UPI00332C0487